MTGEKPLDLFAVRSLLFLPASNPRAIAKARSLNADLVILDLEDAVKGADKESARAAAVEAAEQDWPMPVAIRINPSGTAWHQGDVEAVRASRADAVVIPLVTGPDQLGVVGQWAGRPVLAMIETAAGVLAARDIAGRAAALIAGTNDLSADLGLPLGSGRGPLQTALQMILLAARAATIPAFDGVFNAFRDAEGFALEAAEGRALGFDGKSLIHPDQIEACHRAFSPSAEEIERAAALVAAFEGGAQRFGDEMIEHMHVETARRTLARAGVGALR